MRTKPAGIAAFCGRSWRAVFVLRSAARRRGIVASGRRTIDTFRESGVSGVLAKLHVVAHLEGLGPATNRQLARGGVTTSPIRTPGPNAVFLLRAAVRRWGIMSTPLRTLRTLQTGGILAVVRKLQDLVLLEGNASVGSVPAAGLGVRLDQDFGVDCARWDKFLSQQVLEGFQRGWGQGVWVIVTGESGSPKLVETRQSLIEAGFEPGAIEISGAGEFSDCLRATLTRAKASDLVWFMGAGDKVDARAWLLLERAARNNADLCFFDTYFVEGDRAFPQLHPGFNEVFGLNCNYFRSRFLARAGALRRLAEIGPLTDAYMTAQALLTLRLRGEAVSGTHLPSVFVRIEDSRAAIAQESLALIARSDAQFRQSNGDVKPDWNVSVVICTRDKGHLLRQTVRGIMDTARDLVEEIVVVSHGTRNPYALKTLADLRRQQVRVFDYEGPFNFSRQCNLGARNTRAPFLLFINDDIVPVTADWLTRLLAPFDNPAVGMTGPLLLYPDETVQHAGMFLGYKDSAGHVLRSAHLPAADYLFMTQAPREVSCLTGAALVVERGLFDDLNGFDPLLGTFIQDVDLSLRVGRSGRRLIFNPQSVLLHMESVSVREALEDPGIQATRKREAAYFHRRWSRALEQDAFHNPSFDPQAEDLRSLRRGTY